MSIAGSAFENSNCVPVTHSVRTCLCGLSYAGNAETWINPQQTLRRSLLRRRSVPKDLQCRRAIQDNQIAFLAAGIVHVPLMIDGSVSVGQYIRSIRMNSPAGAGSQFDSLSLPGESFWM